MRVFQPHPQVTYRRIGDEVVLVHLGTELVYAMNETAARLWELVVEGGAWEDVERQLLAEFDVEPAAVRGEIQRTLAEMTAAGLLVEVSEDA